jgi:hypothetical protein
MRRRLVAVAVVAFAGSFAAAYAGVLPTVKVELEPSRKASPVSPSRIGNGPDLAMIFIGSSGCAAAQDKGLPDAVAEIRASLAASAAASGHSFSTIGIARDRDVDAGITYLRRFSPLDEVVSGLGWLNTGLLKYVWEDVPGMAATPQILVVERNVARDTAGTYRVSGERTVTRKVGIPEIQSWRRLGAPIPRLSGSR